MEENVPDEPIFRQSPHFDFFDASENLGFDWASFKENNFKKFIEKTFITDFIELRKAYIKREYHEKVRKLSHLFKGSFA
jgi:hypothetical protein